MAIDSQSNLYIVDQGNNRIRKVDANGIISTVARQWNSKFRRDGGRGTAAEHQYPSDVVVDGSGNIYIADTHNYSVRKVDANGVISTVAGSDLTWLGVGFTEMKIGGPATACRPQSR